MQSQSSRITVSSKRAPGFYNQIKNSILVVPLSDTHTHEDSALMAAVETYWKACPYKFISEL